MWWKDLSHAAGSLKQVAVIKDTGWRFLTSGRNETRGNSQSRRAWKWWNGRRTKPAGGLRFDGDVFLWERDKRRAAAFRRHSERGIRLSFNFAGRCFFQFTRRHDTVMDGHARAPDRVGEGFWLHFFTPDGQRIGYWRPGPIRNHGVMCPANCSPCMSARKAKVD